MTHPIRYVWLLDLMIQKRDPNLGGSEGHGTRSKFSFEEAKKFGLPDKKEIIEMMKTLAEAKNPTNDVQILHYLIDGDLGGKKYSVTNDEIEFRSDKDRLVDYRDHLKKEAKESNFKIVGKKVAVKNGGETNELKLNRGAPLALLKRLVSNYGQMVNYGTIFDSIWELGKIKHKITEDSEKISIVWQAKSDLYRTLCKQTDIPKDFVKPAGDGTLQDGGYVLTY